MRYILRIILWMYLYKLWKKGDPCCNPQVKENVMLDVCLDIQEFDRMEDLSEFDEETRKQGRMFFWIETACPEIRELSLEQQQWLYYGN